MTQATADAIRERMKVVRCDLGDDFDDVVMSARQMANWHSYVRRYPWACMTGAALAGFLIVPRRVELITPDTATLLELARQNKLVVKADSRPQEKGGFAGAMFSLIANAAVRGLMAYVGQQAGKVSGRTAADATET